MNLLFVVECPVIYYHVTVTRHEVWISNWIYRVYQNSMAKLQEQTPHTETRNKVYDNIGLEMHNYRVSDLLVTYYIA
jgi:hypothetical protein